MIWTPCSRWQEGQRRSVGVLSNLGLFRYLQIHLIDVLAIIICLLRVRVRVRVQAAVVAAAADQARKDDERSKAWLKDEIHPA